MRQATGRVSGAMSGCICPMRKTGRASGCGAWRWRRRAVACVPRRWPIAPGYMASWPGRAGWAEPGGLGLTGLDASGCAGTGWDGSGLAGSGPAGGRPGSKGGGGGAGRCGAGALWGAFFSRTRNGRTQVYIGIWILVEPDGIEPTTSSLPAKRSPS